MGKKDQLTPKQKKFCDKYLKLGNATQAAKNAGYSEKTAYRTGAVSYTHLDVYKRQI